MKPLINYAYSHSKDGKSVSSEGGCFYNFLLLLT